MVLIELDPMRNNTRENVAISVGKEEDMRREEVHKDESYEFDQDNPEIEIVVMEYSDVSNKGGKRRPWLSVSNKNVERKMLWVEKE